MNNATVREGRVWLPKKTPPLSDAQKPWRWAPLRVGRPVDYLPSGTVGQWPPATGQWWNERRGGDPKTDQVTQGAASELPGWQPKERAAQLPQKRGTLDRILAYVSVLVTEIDLPIFVYVLSLSRRPTQWIELTEARATHLHQMKIER